MLVGVNMVQLLQLLVRELQKHVRMVLIQPYLILRHLFALLRTQWLHFLLQKVNSRKCGLVESLVDGGHGVVLGVPEGQEVVVEEDALVLEVLEATDVEVWVHQDVADEHVQLRGVGSHEVLEFY